MNLLKTLNFITNHPLTDGRPLAALGRFVHWQLASRLKGELQVDWIAGSKLAVKRGMTGATGNIYCGLHEFADMAFILHVLRPGDLFVDVGANIGSYTVLASKVCGSDSLAIEPDPHTAIALKSNIDLNNIEHIVRVCTTAVSDQVGTISFTRGKDTMNRVATANDPATQLVPVTTLDQLLVDVKPTIIKMDIEGHESQALKGALATLANKSVLAIETETADEEVRALLEKFGFEIQFYDPWSRTLSKNPGHLHASNSLFVRDADEINRRVRSAAYRSVVGVEF